MPCTGPSWNDRRRALAKALQDQGYSVWNKCSDRKENGRRRKWYICKKAGWRSKRLDMVDEERMLRIVQEHIPSAELHGRNRLNVIVVWKEEDSE